MPRLYLGYFAPSCEMTRGRRGRREGGLCLEFYWEGAEGGSEGNRWGRGRRGGEGGGGGGGG